MFKVQDNSSSNVEVVNLYKQCVADLSISLKTWEKWCGSHYTPQMFKCLGMVYSRRLDRICSHLCCSRRRVVSHPRTGYTPLLDSWLSIYFTKSGPTLGTKVCHLIPISLSQCTPVSSWSKRPLHSGGDSSCSWVFCLCTGPKGESYTQLEGWQSVSPVAIVLIRNRVHSRGYSCKKTQTSSFSCKIY